MFKMKTTEPWRSAGCQGGCDVMAFEVNEEHKKDIKRLKI